MSLEWGNDAYLMHRKPASLLRRGDRFITSNELARLSQLMETCL